MLDDYKNSSEDTVPDEHYSCCIGRQATINPHTQATVLVCCEAIALVKVETHGNFVERRCSVTA